MLAYVLEVGAVSARKSATPKDVLSFVNVNAAAVLAIRVERTRSAGSTSTGVMTKGIQRSECFRKTIVELPAPVGTRVPNDNLIGLRS